MVEFFFFHKFSFPIILVVIWYLFFFFQLIFSTLMKDQTGNSLFQAEAMFQ